MRPFTPLTGLMCLGQEQKRKQEEGCEEDPICPDIKNVMYFIASRSDLDSFSG